MKIRTNHRKTKIKQDGKEGKLSTKPKDIKLGLKWLSPQWAASHEALDLRSFSLTFFLCSIVGFFKE